jgi:hypothetical protein
MDITREGVTEEITEEQLQEYLSQYNLYEKAQENGDSMVYTAGGRYVGFVVRSPPMIREPKPPEEKPKPLDDIPF